MITAIFTKFWFIFLPLIFYVIWTYVMRRRVGDNGQMVAEHIRKGLLFWAIMVTLGLLLACFIWIGFESSAPQVGTYVPPKNVDGVIIPGHVIPPQE